MLCCVIIQGKPRKTSKDTIPLRNECGVWTLYKLKLFFLFSSLKIIVLKAISNSALIWSTIQLFQTLQIDQSIDLSTILRDYVTYYH